MMHKKQVFYYDLIKIIAAYMVCFYHLGLLDLGSVTTDFYFPNFNRVILNLCAMSVPLFFMVNGALLLRRNYTWKESILRFLKLTILYYFWVVVIGQIGEWAFGIEQDSVLDILNGYRNSITVHLWFFKTIARLAILTPIFKFIYDRESKLWTYGLMGCLFVIPFVYNYFVLFAAWFQIEPFSTLPVTGVDTMYSVLYFFLGKVLSDLSKEEKKSCIGRKILALISILTGWIMSTVEVTLWTNLRGEMYDGVNSSFPTLGALLMAAGVFYLLSKMNPNITGNVEKMFRLCADHVMGVYIFHPIIVQLLNRVFRTYIGLLPKCLITLLIVIGLSVITAIIKKVPVIKKAVEI